MYHAALLTAQCTMYMVFGHYRMCFVDQGRDQTSDQRFPRSLLLDFLAYAQNMESVLNLYLTLLYAYWSWMKQVNFGKFEIEHKQITRITVVPSKISMAKQSFCQFSYKESRKGYGTGNSQAVTHPSTNPACGCLTSEIERNRVYSTEYGRIRQERDL